MMTEKGQFLREMIKVDAMSYPSVTYLPPGYTGDRQYPVILSLHGAGEAGKDGERQTQVGIGVQLRRRPELYPAIVVMPQSPGQWRGRCADLALRALTLATEQFNVNMARQYITGMSIGGFGAWYLAAAYPDLFAAAVPICGGGDPATMATRLIDLPIWAFHGAADDVVPADYSREMVEAIKALGGNKIRYTELPGVGHNSWDPAYSNSELPKWLLQQSREKVAGSAGRNR